MSAPQIGPTQVKSKVVQRDAHSQTIASSSQARLDAVWKGTESMFEFNRQSRNFQHSRLLVSILGKLSPAKTFEFKPGFHASLIQTGTKLSLNSLGQPGGLPADGAIDACCARRGCVIAYFVIAPCKQSSMYDLAVQGLALRAAFGRTQSHTLGPRLSLTRPQDQRSASCPKLG